MNKLLKKVAIKVEKDDNTERKTNALNIINFFISNGYKNKMKFNGLEVTGFIYYIHSDGVTIDYSSINNSFIVNNRTIMTLKEAKELINKSEDIKSIQIDIPEGYEIDEENSTFTDIKFKPKSQIGYVLGYDGNIFKVGLEKENAFKIKEDIKTSFNECIFATYADAKSALVMAKITQLLPKYNASTYKDWSNNTTIKYTICRTGMDINKANSYTQYRPLAFNTSMDRDKFYDDHFNLIKDYYKL